MKKTLIKKIICIVSALTIAFIVPDVYNEKTSAVDTTITYYSYNAQTGEFIDEYTLNSLGAIGTTSNSRSGSVDDRVLDWTKQGVVKIFSYNSEGTQRGTGFVVSEHVIATAAHVVYDSSIDKILLFKGNSEDYITLKPVEYHLSKKFTEEYPISNEFGNPNKTDAEREARCHDYALITVEEDLSDYMCFNLGVATDSVIENKEAITVTGFPADVRGNKVNNNTKNNMYSATGVFVDMYEHLNDCTNSICYIDYYRYLQNKDLIFCYDTYASSGDSGGPVYMTESYNGNVYNTVVAIHVGGGCGDYRMGVRITTDLLHFYNNNSNLNW